MTSFKCQFVYISITSVMVIATAYFSLSQNILALQSVKNTKAEEHNNHKRRFTILLYTRYFGRGWQDKYPLTIKTSVPQQKPCSTLRYTNCDFTNDISQIHSSDVIFFHGNDLPSPQDMGKIPRNPQQLWILMTQENPFTVNTGTHRIGDYDEFFNWTATYHSKSEIWTPYYEVHKKGVAASLASNKTRYFVNNTEKTRLVMAIMSNCIAFRIRFIESLKRFTNVDLYGRCKNNVNPDLSQCERETQECDRLQSTYKFFLAIENAYCSDYVTEKFYKQALLKGLVPIVINGGKMVSRRIAPPHSYINVLDFKDMKSLADYIDYLDKNQTAYNEYHEWRLSYDVVPHNYGCNLCKTLNKKHKNVKRWKAKKLSRFWSGNSCVRFKKAIFQKYLK